VAAAPPSLISIGKITPVSERTGHMAFKLTRSEATRKENLVEELRTKAETLLELQTKETPLETLTTALAELLVVINETEDLREEVASRLRDEFDEKSEKWQESDKAGEVNEFIEEWENVSFNEPELGNPAEVELEDYCGDLENLPDEVS